MQVYKVARVHWLDASLVAGWHNSDQIDDIASEIVQIESVGWLVKDEPEYVMLAMSVGKYRAAELLRIPRKYIVELFTL